MYFQMNTKVERIDPVVEVEQLREDLRKLRLNFAIQEGLPAFCIFYNSTFGRAD